MIFQTFAVNNFGIYRGNQQFDLSPQSKKPIILIGALNGSGKTTFLHAIDFCLYGKQSNFFQSQKMAYEAFLRKNINNENFDEGTQLELVFHRKLKGKLQKFKIIRSWKEVNLKIREDLHVFIDDTFDEDITKDWDNFVDQILPSRVASLFFFDGEKIEELADLDKSKEVLKKAINSLLGLEIVEQLDIDLEEFKKRSLVELKTDEEKNSILEFEKEAEKLQLEIKKYDELIVKQEDEMTKLNFEIKELDVQLSKQGLSYYEKRKEYDTQLQSINEKKKSVSEDLVDLASKEAPFLVLPDEMEEVFEQSKKLLDVKSNDEFQKNVNQILKDVDQYVMSHSTDKKFNSDFTKFIEAKKIKPTAKKSTQNIVDHLNYEELKYLCSQGLDALNTQAKKLMKVLDRHNEEFERVTLLINKIPSNDKILPLIEKQDELKKLALKVKTKINVLRDQRQEFNGPLVILNRKIEQEYNKKSEQDLINLDSKRFVDYSHKVKTVLDEFHLKVLDHHINKLEKLILDCFKNLHRKKNFIQKIKINTSTFDLQIFEKKDVEVDTTRLSAGERQLLAVAILWGLAKASNSAAPTIIDTPLGRLDSDHRMNLVKEYFPNASKQVILLSTDEEINSKYHKHIKPFLNRSYKVEYDQAKNGSTVQEGYFF